MDTVIAVIILLGLAVPVFGATITSEITVTKGEAVLISNIDDWNFGVYSPLAVTNGGIRFRDDTCVFSSTGGYTLNVTSQNGGNRLRMLNTNGDTLRYVIRVRYRDGNRFRNRRIRNSDSILTGLTGSQALDCSDQGARDWNLSFRPVIGKNRFNNAPPGIYTDLVTIVVSPE